MTSSERISRITTNGTYARSIGLISFSQEQGHRVQEQGLRVQEQGLGVQEQGLKVQEQGLKVQEQGLRVQEQGHRVQEQGLKVQELLSRGFDPFRGCTGGSTHVFPLLVSEYWIRWR